MKTIYILSSCDIWKSRNSISLIAATTSLDKLKSIVIQEIKNGDMEYKRGYENLSITDQVKMFKQDCKENDIKFGFSNIDYGYVEEVLDGEVLY